MYAIAFDLTVAEVEALHPRGYQAAYAEIGAALRRFDFRRIQGSVYLTDNENMYNLTRAMMALRALPWFSDCVRDIRAFRVEQWSDFTPMFKDRSANQ
ncbi:MAG: virulence factor [Caulobacteraceae bacterium]